MVRINLLPKEDKVRKRSSFTGPSIKMPTGIENYIGIGVVVLVIIILSFVHIGQKKSITRLNTNIQETRQELRKLEEVVKLVKELDMKRKDLNTRIEIIRGLNRGRFEKSKFLYTLSSILPDYCWIQNLDVKVNAITIKGITFSNQVIAAFMRRLQGERIFQNIELKGIVSKDVDNHNVMEFDLGIQLIGASTGFSQEKPGTSNVKKSEKGTTK